MSNVSPPSSSGDTQASMVTIEAITECDNLAFELKEWTLYDYIDPDALDDILSRDDSVEVKFNVEEMVVTVWQDESIQVRVTERQEEHH